MSFLAAMPPENAPPQAAEKARGACRPGRDELSIGKLQRRLCRLKKRRSRKKSREATKVVAAATKSTAEGGAKAAKRQKDLILLVRICRLCVLLRGLQNLELPERETDWYFLRRAKSTAKTRRGLRPSGLPGTIQISARYEIFADMTGVHQVTGGAGERNFFGYRR